MNELMAVIRKWQSEKGRWLIGNGVQPGSVKITEMKDAMDSLAREFIGVMSVNGTPHPQTLDSLAELCQLAKTQIESERSAL